MFSKIIKQNEGVILQVTPNFSNEDIQIEQIIELIHDVKTNKWSEVMKHKDKFKNFSKIKNNLKFIFEILTRHANVISYEIYSDFNKTVFNFWIPKHLHKNFSREIYKVWEGVQIDIIDRDYIEFDPDKTTFAMLRFCENSIIPLKTGKEAGIISRLINHLDSIEINEKALIQILMKPEGIKWQSKAKSSYKRLKNGENISNATFKDNIYRFVNSFFNKIFQEPEDEDIFQKERKIKFDEVLSKLSQKAINVNIRIAVESPSRESSNSIINGIVNAFKIMEGDENSYNTFIRKNLLPIQNKEKFISYMKERRAPIITLNGKDMWVTSEIANFIQLPDREVESSKIKRINIRQTFVSDELKSESGLRLGKHTYKGHTNMLYWDADDIDTLMRPVVQISNPGEGKSISLINRALDWFNIGYGGAVIDVADGKVVDNILYQINSFHPHLKDKVVIIDCNDLNNPPGLSDFSESKVHDRSVNQMLSQLWTEFYVNFFGIDDHHRSKDFIRKSSIPIFSFEENTILEQYLMISNESFRSEFLDKIKDIKRLFRYWVWWNNFDSKPHKVKTDEVKAILNKFDLLMDNGNLKNIICQRNTKVPKFRELMDDRKIVLIKAGEGAVGYEGSRMIGALSLMKFWMAALSRHNLDEDERMPFKVFADEPQNYIASGDYVKEMLAKSRKYRLGLELFFQDPVQIEEKDKNLLHLLISMNPHLILGKMGSDQYKKYFKERISPLMPAEGSILPKYHWIVSIFKDKNPVQPFIMEAVDMPSKLDDLQIRMAKSWINQIKFKYATPVEIVEYDIEKRELIGYVFEKDDNDDQIITINKGNATKIL